MLTAVGIFCSVFYRLDWTVGLGLRCRTLQLGFALVSLAGNWCAVSANKRLTDRMTDQL